MHNIKILYRRYPFQFWLMFLGLIVSSTGTTMVWPFLTIYASEKLLMPMAAITSLMTFNSVSGFASNVVAGSLVDRFGRKSIMVIGLFGMALVYLLYIFVAEYWQFALLMLLSGIFNPLYRVGTDASVADMVPPEDRTQAYSLVRMARNVGVALGPILGGVVLSRSYTIGFVSATVALVFFGFLTLFFLKETLQREEAKVHENFRDQMVVIREAFRNNAFSKMVLSFTLMEICATLIWVFLSVYIKNNFGISESQYSWIPTTNALMVIFIQVGINRIVARQEPTKVMPIGAAFYPLSMLIVALSRNFWGFLLAMVVLTIGELITAPTATAYVANIAPPEQRGRYLGYFGLTWYAALSIGPMGAGFLTDNISTTAPWYAGVIVGILAVISYLSLHKNKAKVQNV